MDTLYQAFVTLVGDPPPGWEPVAYVMCGTFAVFMVTQLFGLLYALFRGNK